MALPSYTEVRYRIWHYFYLFICTCVFVYLIAPLFVIFPLSFSADEFLVFSEGMKRLDPDAFLQGGIKTWFGELKIHGA